MQAAIKIQTGEDILEVDTDNPEYLRTRLKNKGYTEIGSGCSAKIFHKEGEDWVVKVADRFDKCAAYYEHLLEAGILEKHAPKVRDLQLRRGFYIAVVEKLEPLSVQEKYCGTIWKGDEVEYFKEAPVSMYPFLRHLSEKRLLNDLHDDNMMKRADGTWVITDPVC